MKITAVIPDIMGKDLWIATYLKNSRGRYTGSIQFLNFINVYEHHNLQDVVFRFITEGELLTHGRYLDEDSVLFTSQHYASPSYLDNHYEVIEPLEIYTFDDLLEMGWEAGEEE